jgi:checkpoint serine/threonine-protein kinase
MEEETHTEVQRLDPETEFLLSNRQTGTEWELFKENVRPLKRGRKVEILNDSLKSHNDNRLKKSLLEHRRSISLLCLNSLTQLYYL